MHKKIFLYLFIQHTTMCEIQRYNNNEMNHELLDAFALFNQLRTHVQLRQE